MIRKSSVLAVAALTGVFGFGTTPLWSGSNPEHGQSGDHMSMEQTPETRDQTQLNGNWSETAENEMSQRSSGLEATGQLDDQSMAQRDVNEHSSESSAGYEGRSAESEERSASLESSDDSEATSTNSPVYFPSSCV